MCGRFTCTLIANKKKVSAQFGIKGFNQEVKPIFNAAPSQFLPVITNLKPDELVFYHWGLIPFWSKDKSMAFKMINARSETIMQKPSFKGSFKKKRCLVLADGFFEWKKEGKTKIPYRITLKDKSLFAFAGIWEAWTDPKTKKQLESFAIITTKSNEMLKEIHDRMPVILTPDQKQKWLDTTCPPEKAIELLKPIDPKHLVIYPVSTLVNSPKNNSEEVIKRANATLEGLF